TGQYPATNGMVGYQEGHPIESPTLPECLHQSGYQTAIVGRYMHQSPYNHSYGFDTRILGSGYIENDDYAQALEQALPGAGGLKGAGISFNGWTARSWPYPEHLHPTHWVVQQAHRYLKEQRQLPESDSPLFLTVSFYAPHPPLIPPAFYFERYHSMELPAPATGDWALPPENDGRGQSIDAHRVHLQGEALRSAQAGYFGLINHIDDQLYWLMHEFISQSREQNRPWLIVLTSDHGEMLNDHYYFRKCQPYEGSSRIPFLIQGAPELGFKSRQTCDQPVCLEDLMPTLLELAEVPVPGDIDGQSLVPILQGEDIVVRDYLHGEHSPCYSDMQAYHFLTDGHSKYIWRPFDGSEQLFDLDNDPQELQDLMNVVEKDQLLNSWRKRMIDTLTGRPEGFTDGTRLIPGRPYHAVLS
ncbi:MAG: sulfatase-like hydrolase/transferase, partial [Anaerolineae bacterium]|nr:sulfatase-like hydrolase/transferase [Anaerolineae bacterium]